MTQYIDPKNQTLLWQTIQKHPFTIQVFPPGSEQHKTNWFKNIISEIYTSLNTTNITPTRLLEINKETLRRMIEEMRQFIQPPQIQPKQSPIQSANPPYSLDSDRSYSRESILQDKTAIFQKDLENRQKEYEQLFQKPSPPPLDFEKTNDQVIHNMDELIAKQLRERENDLQQISRTLPQTSLINQNKDIDRMNIFPKQSPLSINNISDENITIDIVDISKPLAQKKQVSWDMSDALESKIDELTKKYTKLIEFLEKKIPDFQTEFSQTDPEISIETEDSI